MLHKTLFSLTFTFTFRLPFPNRSKVQITLTATVRLWWQRHLCFLSEEVDHVLQTDQIYEICIARIGNKVHFWRRRFWWRNLVKEKPDSFWKHKKCEKNCNLLEGEFFPIASLTLIWPRLVFGQEFDCLLCYGPANKNKKLWYCSEFTNIVNSIIFTQSFN